MLRRQALLLPLALTACGDEEPTTFAPFRSDFLTPLRLAVGSLEVTGAPPPGRFDAQAPIPPATALRQLAEERLSAAGAGGRAVVTLQEARVGGSSRDFDGALALRVDVVAADGRTTGYAEARVARSMSVDGGLRPALYEIVRRMVADMNVELEYQVRRSLRDVLEATGPAPAPPAVQQQDLPLPPSRPRL